MTDWQPIATAPRDGTVFAFIAPDVECGMSWGYYCPRGKLRSVFDGKEVGWHVTPPHLWHPLPPLPPPPKEAADG